MSVASTGEARATWVVADPAVHEHGLDGVALVDDVALHLVLVLDHDFGQDVDHVFEVDDALLVVDVEVHVVDAAERETLDESHLLVAFFVLVVDRVGRLLDLRLSFLGRFGVHVEVAVLLVARVAHVVDLVELSRHLDVLLAVVVGS